MKVTRRQRWQAPQQMAQGQAFHPRATAPREIPADHDLVAALLAEDAKAGAQELWLGLQLVAAGAALLAGGAGLPLLALAFTVAPLVGIGMEIFDGWQRRRA